MKMSAESRLKDWAMPRTASKSVSARRPESVPDMDYCRMGRAA